MNTREEWLHNAIEAMRPWQGWRGIMPTRVQVSVGFPKGSHGRAQSIGQCWGPHSAADGVAHLFISPVLGPDDVATPSGVLATLTHELVHASVGVEAKHGKLFKRMATEVGLTGKMTATSAGAALVPRLERIAGELGEYPHGALTLPVRGSKGSRLLKAMPPCCDYIIRVSRLLADRGLPCCGEHGDKFELVGVDKGEE